MRRNAQSQSEYALGLALITLVALAALQSIGSNTSDLFTNMVGKKSPVASAKLALSKKSLQLSGNPSVALTLQDGSSLSLTNYPTNLAAAIDTAGANGTQKILAQSLLSLAEQLKEQGKIDEDQYQKIRDIANQGFTVAQGTLLTEQAFLQSKGDPKLYNSLLATEYFQDAKNKNEVYQSNRFVFQDVLAEAGLDIDAYNTAAKAQFVEQHGTLPSQGGDQSYIHALDTPQILQLKGVYEKLSDQSLQNFVQARAENTRNDPGSNAILASYILAEKSGALQDPAVKALVERNVFDIIRVSGLVNYSGQVGGLTSLKTEVINTKADNICTAGRGENQNNITCSKQS